MLEKWPIKQKSFFLWTECARAHSYVCVHVDKQGIMLGYLYSDHLKKTLIIFALTSVKNQYSYLYIKCSHFWIDCCGLAGKVLAIGHLTFSKLTQQSYCNCVSLPYAVLTRFLTEIQRCLHKIGPLLTLLPASSSFLKFEDFCKSPVLPAFPLRL